MKTAELKTALEVIKPPRVKSVTSFCSLKLDNETVTCRTSWYEGEAEVILKSPSQGQTVEILVDFLQLFDAVKSCKEATISLKVETYNINNKRKDFLIVNGSTLYTFPLDGIPPKRSVVKKQAHVLSDQFFNALSVNLPFALSNDSDRVNLISIFYDSVESALIATNGAALAVSKIKSLGNKDLLFPGREMVILQRAIKKLGISKVTLTIKDRLALFSANNFSFICTLISSTYPQWETVVPKYNSWHKSQIYGLELQKAIKKVLAQASLEDTNQYEIECQLLICTQNNVTLNRNDLTIPIGKTDHTNNQSPLLDCRLLKKLPKRDLTLRLDIDDEYNPLIFEANNESFFLIMPMRKSHSYTPSLQRK